MQPVKYQINRFLILLALAASFCQPVFAQKMRHAASQRNIGGPGGVKRTAGGTNKSINGGSVRSPDRNAKANNQNIGNKTSVNSGNKNISGNTVNINVDNSKNINVVNNRNTVVRRNSINTYVRPPYVWGGKRYYCYHPYFYHPYHPFYWGPVWHPWGFFVAALATTAIVVSVENAEKAKEQYYFDQGVWYAKSQGGYTAVQAPVGGIVTSIPSGAETVVVNNTTNYYYGGAYYEKDGKEYKVVPPPAGAVVQHLPEGGEEVKIGDQTYVKVGETYYQPVEDNKYEVAQVEEGSK